METTTNTNTNDNKKYITKEQIEEYKNIISNEYIQIRLYEKEIKNHYKNIEKYQNILILKCNHNRVPDRSCSYDRTTFYCDICNQDL